MENLGSNPMRVSKSLRDSYDSVTDEVMLLGQDADERIGRAAREKKWHYESRIKVLQSFALKAETGRVSNLNEMEDHFAATLVVTERSAIRAAMDLVMGDLGYRLAYRRPKSDQKTTKPSDSFRFDDLRLYLKSPIVEGTRPKVFQDRIFELQVKTFLQHAWGIATHDSIYKNVRPEWGRERVGFQTRAGLEQIECVLSAIAEVNDAAAFPTSGWHKSRATVLDIIEANFVSDRLPEDRRRLSDTVTEALNAVGATPEELSVALNNSRELLDVRSLSPFQTCVAALSVHVGDFVKRMNATDTKFKVLITPELLEVTPVLKELTSERSVRVGDVM